MLLGQDSLVWFTWRYLRSKSGEVRGGLCIFFLSSQLGVGEGTAMNNMLAGIWGGVVRASGRWIIEKS